MKQRVLRYFVLLGAVAIIWLIFFPPVGRSRHNARRASCQSNLKQILLAVKQYASDYDDKLPPRQLVKSLASYTNDYPLFQCSETSATSNTTDYFYNARFIGKEQWRMKKPEALILFGDGQDDAPLDTTLGAFSQAWRSDENSPAFRHLGMANYGFADGHVKALKVSRVSNDLRMVTR